MFRDLYISTAESICSAEGVDSAIAAFVSARKHSRFDKGV